MSKHTPSPWQQGRLLRTKNTAIFSEEEIVRSEAIEKKNVFANFSSHDEGRSRVLIARCETEEDAMLIAAAPELLEAVHGLLNIISETRGLPAYNAVLDAQKAIAKAEGKQ